MRSPGPPAVLAVLGGVLLSGVAPALTACSLRPQAAVPDVRHTYPAEAEQQLTTAGLTATYPSVPAITGADCGMNGYAVDEQDPTPGTPVDVGSPVTLTLLLSANAGGVCPGAPVPAGRVSVPDVRGRPVNEALTALTSTGLLVDVSAAGRVHTLTVTAQTPSAGSVIAFGSPVTLTVG